MSLAMRKEVLKEALEDPETRLKMDCALTWDEIKDILLAFAKKKGCKIAEVNQNRRI